MMNLANPEFDWDDVGDSTGAVLIDSYELDRDTGQLPYGTARIGSVRHGLYVRDRCGYDFRVMGYGSVQGSVVIEDPDGNLYQTDTDVIVWLPMAQPDGE